MSYVSLSRVKNLNWLAIFNFDKDKITCRSKVVQKMDRLCKQSCNEPVPMEECKLLVNRSKKSKMFIVMVLSWFDS